MLASDIILKLTLAVLLGGMVGVERELRSKSAGFRTLILVCLASTLFTIFSQTLGIHTSPDRIAANIVVGIGFMGAGVIFRGDNNKVNGITTAASMWMVAALGVGIGSGYYLLSAISCMVVIVVLYLFTFLEIPLDRLNQVRDYKIVYAYEEYNQHKYEALIKKYHLKIKSRTLRKTGNIITGSWLVQGTERNHHNFIECILKDAAVNDFAF
ncbi:MAG: MgtC/SapB family protein [Taibaiella sp.]|nr:MgtC/SapB family protein [Taibaiella sp.]